MIGELKHAVGLIRGFRRAVGLVDEGGVSRMSDQLHPVIDLWSRPEWCLLREEFLMAGYAAVSAGGAGTRSCIQLWNPAGSGRLIVLEELHASITPLEIRWTTAVLANVVTTQYQRDGRNAQAPVGMYTGVPAAPGVITYQLRHSTTASSFGQLPWVIGPQNGLVMCPTSDNAGITGAMAWRVRSLLPGEAREELR